MQHRRPLWAALVAAAAILGACQDDGNTPLGSGAAPPAEQLAPGGERPFYYYQGAPVYLDADPTRMVVASGEASPAQAAREVLAGQGLSVSDGGELPQVPGHRLLHVGGASPVAVQHAAGLLRASRRFAFAAPAFRTAEGGDDVLLVNRVDVEFRANATPAQIDGLIRSLGLQVLRAPKPDSGFFAYRLQYPEGADPLKVSQTLDRNPLVKWADPDKVSNRTRSYVPSDPYYGLQFHLSNSNWRNGVPVDINVQPAWDYTRGSSSIRVAVIDDGVDVLHGNSGGGYAGDLLGPFGGSQGDDEMYSASWPSENAFYPCCGDTHGTSVAGIIAATQDNGVGGAGIAPYVILNAVRIFRGTSVATDAQIGDGINWAWRYASSDVLSNSWGGGAPSNAITTAITNALTQGRGGKGSVVVFAAGNTSDRRNGYIGGVQYPASLSSTTNVISVGAIDRYGDPANYTPQGTIDVVAPSGHDTGHCIGEVVTIDRYGSPGCNDGPSGDINYTSTFSGTSAAAPQVSGVAALLLSYNSSLTSAQVKTKVRGGADYWGASNTYGAGKLNAYRALFY